MTGADSDHEREFATLLVESGVVNVSGTRSFEFVSGISSPFYIDNRRLIGMVPERRTILGALRNLVQEVEPSVVAGTATAGIPWAAWIAEQLDLPMCYVRSGPKPRGLQRQIEGIAEPGSTAVLIEDTVSTGLSSGHACAALSEGSIVVQRCVAIFSFNLAPYISDGRRSIDVVPLTTLHPVIAALETSGRYRDSELEGVREWAASLRLPGLAGK